MNTITTETTKVINERGLDYTPEVFNSIFNELKQSGYVQEYNEWLNSLRTNEKKYMISFMENRLTTDSRIK